MVKSSHLGGAFVVNKVMRICGNQHFSTKIFIPPCYAGNILSCRLLFHVGLEAIKYTSHSDLWAQINLTAAVLNLFEN